MNRRMLATAFALIAIPTAAAGQSRAAIIPFAGYTLPGTLAEDNANDIHLEPTPAPLLGVVFELRLRGAFGTAVGVSRTVGQSVHVIASGTTQFEERAAMTQVTGSIVVRPARRRRTGDRSPLFLEVGGGVTVFSLADNLRPGEDFDGTNLVTFIGAGYVLPVHRRAAMQLFARAQLVAPYSSSGLDAYNQPPLPTNVKGSTMLNLQFGAGLRIAP